MKKNLYVLEQTPQAEILREKLTMLLESDEIANQLLALQILEAGGLPENLRMPLFILAYYKSNENAEKAKNLWKKGASKLAKTFANKQKYNLTYPATDIFENMEQVSDLDVPYFATQVFRLSNGAYGLDYCLKKKIVPPKELFDVATNYGENTYLSFSSSPLTTLPSEIGDYPNLENICIDYSQIESLPEEFYKLRKLRYFSYIGTPFADDAEAIKKLYKNMPMLTAQRFYEEAENLSYSSKYTQAIKKLEKAVEIAPDFIDAWRNMGQYALSTKKYKEAVTPLETAIEKGTTESYCFRNLIEALYRNKEYEKCARLGDKYLQNPQQHQYIHDNEYASADFWFYKGLGHFYIEEHLEAIKCNEECIKVNNYAGGWYNKACSYSKLNRINECITNLEQAILLDRSYLSMAEKDKDNDFANVKESILFKNLLKKM